MLSDEKELAAKAIEVIVSVTESTMRRIRQPSNTSRPIVSAQALTELADEIERQYPGIIARTRELNGEGGVSARQDH